MSFYKGSFHLDVPWDGCMQSDEQHALLAKRQGLVDLLPTLAGPVPLLSVELWEISRAPCLPCLWSSCCGHCYSLDASEDSGWELSQSSTWGGSYGRAYPTGLGCSSLVLWLFVFFQVGFEAEQWEKTTIPYHVASSDTGQQHTAAADKGMPRSHQMGSLLWVTAAVLKGWQSTDPAYSLI